MNDKNQNKNQKCGETRIQSKLSLQQEIIKVRGDNNEIEKTQQI